MQCRPPPRRKRITDGGRLHGDRCAELGMGSRAHEGGLHATRKNEHGVFRTALRMWIVARTGDDNALRLETIHALGDNMSIRQGIFAAWANVKPRILCIELLRDLSGRFGSRPFSEEPPAQRCGGRGKRLAPEPVQPPRQCASRLRAHIERTPRREDGRRRRPNDPALAWGLHRCGLPARQTLLRNRQGHRLRNRCKTRTPSGQTLRMVNRAPLHPRDPGGCSGASATMHGKSGKRHRVWSASCVWSQSASAASTIDTDLAPS